MNNCYSMRARGFIIVRLQSALGIGADGVFGDQTKRAVSQLQMKHKLPVTGKAGLRDFEAAGIAFPSEFERAMNLVANFEGTSFGDCNSTDIDGAGLTLGIAGFTTAHCEVQKLLAQYVCANPQALELLPANLRYMLAEGLSRRCSPEHWRGVFYRRDGVVLKEWRVAFAQWGRCHIMQRLQLAMAEQRFWIRAVVAAKSLGFNSLQAQCFFLDVAVQNGGWRSEHLVTARQMPDWHSDDVPKALAAGARAVAACAKEKWRNDVLSRKMALATGRGVVHGREWSLAVHALG